MQTAASRGMARHASTDAVFEDRRVAGRLLARRFSADPGDDTVVVGIAPGGVVVAAEVAQALQCPLDVIVVRRISTPARPGLGIGSIAPGVVLHDDAAVRDAGVSPRYLRFMTAHATYSVNRAMELYRGRRREVPIEGRVVILVDDLFVTGLTAMTAIAALRPRGPRRIIAASPAATAAAVRYLTTIADDVVCLAVPAAEASANLPRCYRTLQPVVDDVVIDTLRAASPVPE